MKSQPPTAPLADIARINPRRPPDFARPPDDTPTAFIPMTAVQVNGGGANPVLRPYGEVRRGYTFFQSGDVMFAKITPCMQNGKHFIAPQTPGGFGFASTEFHVIRPNTGVLPEWIHLYLRQPDILSEAVRHFTGAVGQQRVPDKFLREIQIPLPTLAEQKRIVKSLSANLRRAEKMKAEIQAQAQAIAALPNSILAQVFTQEKIPKGWKSTPLGSIAKLFAGGPAPQGGRFFASDGPPFLRVRDLGKYGRTDNLIEIQDRLSPDGLAYRPLVLARKNTVVLPKSGAAINTNARGLLGTDAYIVSHLLAIEANQKKVTPEWIYYAMCVVDMTRHSENPSYPSLKKSTVEKIRIPLPPLSEQRIIARMLKAKMKVSAKLSAAARAQLAAAEALADAHLRRAFSGS